MPPSPSLSTRQSLAPAQMQDHLSDRNSHLVTRAFSCLSQAVRAAELGRRVDAVQSAAQGLDPLHGAAQCEQEQATRQHSSSLGGALRYALGCAGKVGQHQG
eukprot:1482061-Pleurochrysis_carterae.AAC.2